MEIECLVDNIYIHQCKQGPRDGHSEREKTSGGKQHTAMGNVKHSTPGRE